ncbi:MAG: DUF4118 domain-containing protein [Oscillospiraceae bacterium]
MRSLSIIVAFLSLASAIGYIFKIIGFPETNIVIMYLFAVILIARYTNGYFYGILSSVISIFAYNFFFTDPYFTFNVSDPSYFITFIVMSITALFTSTLTSHSKKNETEAREREAEAKALYLLTNKLTDATNIHEITSFSIKIISDVLDCKAACLCFDENELPEKTYIQQTTQEKQISLYATNVEEIKVNMIKQNMAYYEGTDFYNWLICGSDNKLGIIRIPVETAVLMTNAQKRLLRAMIESISLAMDRLIVAQQRLKYREENIQEHYRGNLLRSISHDLRTPLSGIMGTSEMLMDMTKNNDPRYDLAKEIYCDADWLKSLVENTLSLTRLQDGKLSLNKQLEAVEEVIGGAIYHIMQRSPQQEITVDIPEELMLVPMDAKLIQQVLINLLDNAIKHTPPGEEINIFVTEDKKVNCAVFSILDRGEGISNDDLPNIFKRFYTSRKKYGDSNHGIGLGLAICDAVINAHGGKIEAHNLSDGKGAEFVFSLPMEVDKGE